MRFALQHQNPLVVIPLAGDAQSDAFQGRGLWLVNPDVLLWSIKPAEDGPAAGTIIRLWNLTDQLQDAPIMFNRLLSQTWQTTHIETDLAKAPTEVKCVFLHFKPWQWQTLRVPAH